MTPDPPIRLSPFRYPLRVHVATALVCYVAARGCYIGADEVAGPSRGRVARVLRTALLAWLFLTFTPRSFTKKVRRRS